MSATPSLSLSLSFPDVVASEKIETSCWHPSSVVPRLPFLVIALVLFLFNRVIFLLKNSRERERESERGRKSHQYFTIGARCRLLLLFSFSFCCINNSLRHDRWTINSLSMRKSDFSLSISLSLSLSFPSACLSILWLTYNSIIILWRNSRSSWQYHLSSKWMGIREGERREGKIRARKSVMNYLSIAFLLRPARSPARLLVSWRDVLLYPCNICLLVDNNTQIIQACCLRQRNSQVTKFQHHPSKWHDSEEGLLVNSQSVHVLVSVSPIVVVGK